MKSIVYKPWHACAKRLSRSLHPPAVPVLPFNVSLAETSSSSGKTHRKYSAAQSTALVRPR